MKEPPDGDFQEIVQDRASATMYGPCVWTHVVCD